MESGGKPPRRGLRYDLTSTYFESDPPFAEGDKRRFGYSREQAWLPPSALHAQRIACT